ncbi:hypothetical protein ACPCHT_01150 [Nucisporomicrobium flavum]|uniref:hypothetical protein n=1 Tax=Nucisporomicrobium flavum TaxID=2785915 RepID=UPI003C2B72C3
MTQPAASGTSVHPVTDEGWARLQRAHAVNQPAAQESRMADQRAGLIAAVASLAASLSLTGATLILDENALDRPSWVRWWFGLVLVLSVTLFVLAAIMSLRVHLERRPLREDLTDHDLAHWVTAAAEQLERDVRANWATAAAKHRKVVWALGCLIAGLVLVAVLTVLAWVSAAAA